jgi:hypothetical protein
MDFGRAFLACLALIPVSFPVGVWLVGRTLGPLEFTVMLVWFSVCSSVVNAAAFGGGVKTFWRWLAMHSALIGGGAAVIAALHYAEGRYDAMTLAIPYSVAGFGLGLLFHEIARRAGG